MANLKPLSNRVLIKRSEATKSKGGILLPDTATEKPKEGQVLAVGPGKTDNDGNVQAMNLSIGDRILFTSYAGTEVKNSDTEDELLIMSEDDVLAVIR
jgi:chaperonin GroES